MTYRAFVVALAMSAAGLLVSSAAKADLITNGSFDNTSGQFVANSSGWDDLSSGSGAITGWTISGVHTLAWGGPNAQLLGLTSSPGNGSHYSIDLTGDQDVAPYGIISQAITTTAGAAYQLTFDLGSGVQYGLQAMLTATAGTTAGVFTSTNPGSTNFWNSDSLNFTATGASTLISFVGDYTGTVFIGLDNVKVVQTAASPVPEPTSWSMMLAGLGVAGYWRTKKNGAVLLRTRVKKVFWSFFSKKDCLT